jgi:filamentous hemagglutinin
LHQPEKTKAQQIAASAKAQGLTNADGSPITAAQIENAMRGANNSQYGEYASTGEGDPSTKLGNWMDLSGDETGAWANQPAGNAGLVRKIQDALEAGYQVKGVQVQVGIPAPGATGATQISIKPWLPN